MLVFFLLRTGQRMIAISFKNKVYSFERIWFKSKRLLWGFVILANVDIELVTPSFRLQKVDESFNGLSIHI